MKLFLVERIDEVGYDEYSGFIIRAKNMQEAREIARERGDYEWKRSKGIRCRVINERGKKGIIMEDYRAG